MGSITRWGVCCTMIVHGVRFGLVRPIPSLSGVNAVPERHRAGAERPMTRRSSVWKKSSGILSSNPAAASLLIAQLPSRRRLGHPDRRPKRWRYASRKRRCQRGCRQIDGRHIASRFGPSVDVAILAEMHEARKSVMLLSRKGFVCNEKATFSASSRLRRQVNLGIGVSTRVAGQ